MAPPTSIDPRSDGYTRTRAAMQSLLDELRARHEQVLGDSGERHDLRRRDPGELAPRERIDLLLDSDSPFLELGALAGWDTPDPLGGGLVLGIGIVEGVECLVLADDGAASGSAASPTAVAKARRGHELALRNRLPLLQLLEPRASERFDPDAAPGPDRAAFRELAELESAGVPTIAVVFGPSTVATTPLADLSEHTIVVAPPEVRGRRDRIDGADELAADDVDGVRLARQVVRNLNWRPRVDAERRITGPLLDADELLGIPSADEPSAVDVREVIWRIVDDSHLDEFKPFTGPSLVTGWASVCGHPVGIVATNGPLLLDESDKGAQFVRRCSARDVPILFVQDHPGSPSGTDLVRAVAGSTVPHLTLLIGPGDAGDDAMATGAYRPRFVFSWPNHRLTADELGRHHWDDAVIDPRDTRVVLGIALTCIHAGR